MAALTGKVAIVTGATRGIGRAIAERLAQDGASVVVNYARSADIAQAVVAGIEAKGGKALNVQADVSQVADVRRLFQEAIACFGQLDILVNNAGSVAPTLLTEVTEEQFDAMFALNTKGVLFALQEAARHMADGGRIVNISSYVTVSGIVGGLVYGGTKGAVEQFTLVAAKELGRRSITVNTVSPGATETEMLKKTTTADIQAYMAQSSPLDRLGQPEDIADVVAFLVSDQARWLTGQNIRATGGVV